jgi:hypothetical protein
MDESTKVEIQLAYRSAVAKCAALPKAIEAESKAALEESRLPFAVESYVGLRASTVVAICSAIKAPSDEAKSQLKACRNLGGTPVCVSSQTVKALIEAAGLNEKVQG